MNSLFSSRNRGRSEAGLALFKPDVSSRIELRLRDEEGNDPLEGVFLPWRDFYQEARTLPEWFDVPGVDTAFLADFRGLLFLRNRGRFPVRPRSGSGSGREPLPSRRCRRFASLKEAGSTADPHPLRR